MALSGRDMIGIAATGSVKLYLIVYHLLSILMLNHNYNMVMVQLFWF